MDRRRSSSRDHAYRDKLLVVSATASPVGLRFVGAVDASNVQAVRRLLDSTLKQHPGTDVHVDVSGLEFADVSGIRALVSAAEAAEDHRRLVLHGLPRLMSRVMDVVGWSDLPALNISDAAFPDGQDGVDGEGPAKKTQ
jgi:anti-anti-sigma factor